MVDFDELKEKTSDFIREKPLLARISAIFLIFFVIALTVVFIQSKKPKAKNFKKPENVLTSEPMTPEYLEIEKDYYLSRKTENSWSNEEINKYFSKPDSRLIEELENSNDKIIDEITGAAP